MVRLLVVNYPVWSGLPGRPLVDGEDPLLGEDRPTATATIREEHSRGTDEDHHKTSYNHTTTS